MLTKKGHYKGNATVKKRGYFKKIITEGNARNSWLINCADVTKIGKTRVVRGR